MNDLCSVCHKPGVNTNTKVVNGVRYQATTCSLCGAIFSYFPDIQELVSAVQSTKEELAKLVSEIRALRGK
jgi:hypothetical protein